MAQKTLSVKLSLNDKQFQSALRKATRKMKKFGQSMKRTGQTMTRSLTLPILALGAASISAFDKQQKAIAQVEAGLKSTGEAVGFTSKQLQQMAADLQKRTLFGDEEILKDATAQLLTFTNIAGEQFERTQVAALNLATRLDGDLKSASIQLGKALNDPIANLSALSRSGIQFSEEQKKVIKSLAQTNRLAEAQTIILDELEKQYGGSAEAAAKAGAGGLKQLQNRLGDTMEEIGKQLLPIVIKLADKINNLLTAFSKLSQETKETALGITLLVGAAGPMLIVLGSLTTILAGISLAAIKVTAAIVALAVGIAYVVDNFEAFKERLTLDFLWNSIIMGVQSTLRAFGSLIDGYNKLIDEIGGEKLDFLKASNEFEKLALNLESAIIATGEYEHEFKGFGESMGNTIDKILPKFREFFKALQGGGGGKKAALPTITPKRPKGMMAGAMIPAVLPDDLLKQIEKFEKKQEMLVELNDEVSQSFQTFGNILEGVFAQALQSSDGFFTTFVDGAKQAFKALMAQLAAMIAMKAILSAVGISSFAEAGTGIGDFLGNLLIPSFSTGGIVSGPTIGLMGEYAGARTNPEVIAPLDKLKSMIGTNGGSTEVFGTISGADILLSSDRARKNRNRTRGY
jgi:hypothetical protein